MRHKSGFNAINYDLSWKVWESYQVYTCTMLKCKTKKEVKDCDTTYGIIFFMFYKVFQLHF